MATSQTEGGPPAQTQQQIKHDWYQTETHVVLSVLAKNTAQEDVRVLFGKQTLSVALRLKDGSETTLGFNLSHPIVPADSTYKILSSKIEVKLKKAADLRWDRLEYEQANVAAPKPGTQNKNWDTVVGELTKDEEKSEGDAALNELFQRIYGDGSDEVKKAMNKSFVESGGTVLSTAWNDVGSRKVDVQPPDGMEWRKWDQ